jgi:hypothetical protein
MKIKEHHIGDGVFARQAQRIKPLFEILKSRGIMQGDDEAAFEDLIHKGATGPLAMETYSFRASAAHTRSLHLWSGASAITHCFRNEVTVPGLPLGSAPLRRTR